MASLCFDLQSLSNEIHDWIYAQSAVKEESLTDWLLYELSKRSSKVAYLAFTRHEEAKHTGADWDWLFVFSDGAVYLRVQAKKLFPAADNYPGLARTNRYGQQIRTLITSATAVSAFPVYAFFSSAGSRTSCIRAGFVQKNGAYLCGAHLIDSKFVKTRTVVSDHQILSVSYPLPCISCCPLVSSIPESAKALIQQIHRYFSINESANSDEDQLGYLDKIPDWAMSVINSDMTFGLDWEQEFASKFGDVDALVIVDRRG